MDEQNAFNSAWFAARLGNAIDVSVDRVIAKPQMVYDAGQAYGVDENGNLYQLGQRNGQFVQSVGVGLGSSQILLLVGLLAVVLMAGK